MLAVSGDVVALSLLAALVWGFEPVVSKRAMAAGGTALQASLVVVSVTLVSYWAALAVSGGIGGLPQRAPRALAVFLVAGIVAGAFGRITTFLGVHRVGASINSAGISTRPLFATALALGWLGESVGFATVAGTTLLVAGLVVLALSKGGDLGGWRLRELVFPLSAAVAFALGNVLRRFGFTTTDVTVLEALALNPIGAMAFLVAYAVLRRRDAVLNAPRETYPLFAVSGLLTAVGLLALFAALERGQVAIVDPLTGTAPLFTAVFAAVLLRDLERVTRGVLVGATLIVAGAALITAL